ncbi:hypothetical protein ABK040_004855 [Willaertia magna]
MAHIEAGIFKGFIDVDSLLQQQNSLVESKFVKSKLKDTSSLIFLESSKLKCYQVLNPNTKNASLKLTQTVEKKNNVNDNGVNNTFTLIEHEIKFKIRKDFYFAGKLYYLPTINNKIPNNNKEFNVKDILGNSCNSMTNILCFHGWYDNANSLLPLIPYLFYLQQKNDNRERKQIQYLITLDLPGCGNSSHYNHAYNLDGYLIDIFLLQFAILQWKENCILLTHSLGGLICTTYISLFGNYSKSNICISLDSFGYMSEDVKRVEKYKTGILMSINGFENKPFELKDMIEKRCKELSISSESAIILLQRSIVKCGDEEKGKAEIYFDEKDINENGLYNWKHDPYQRIMPASNLFLERDILTLLSQHADKLYFVHPAQSSQSMKQGILEERKNLFKESHIIKMKDCVGHHFHMEYPREVACCILEKIVWNLSTFFDSKL